MDSPALIFRYERDCLCFCSEYILADTRESSMAVWGQRWFIVVPLVLLILGHWSLLLQGEYRLHIQPVSTHPLLSQVP